MDLDEIRKLSIVAMFADDEIMEQVVLKGGNALNLVYKIGSRSSIDLDFSLAADFKDVHDAEARILKALRSRFGSVDLTVFDELFEKKPALDQPDESPRWGGYQISFKLLPTAKVSRHATAIAKAKHERLGTELAALQRDSLVVGPNSLRTFTIEISKYEACAGKQKRELDNYEIYVYTTEMLAIEKVRAICQQMPGYAHRNRPRARDSYDIDAIAESSPIDFGSPRVHLRQELRGAAGDRNAVAFLLEETRDETLPSRYHLDLVQEDVDLVADAPREEFVVGVEDHPETLGREARETLVLEIHQEDPLLRNAARNELVDDLVEKERLAGAPQSDHGVDLARPAKRLDPASEEREGHPLLVLEDDPLEFVLHHEMRPPDEVYLPIGTLHANVPPGQA